jgi:diguanylate cyclase (GGDEF)-like protein
MDAQSATSTQPVLLLIDDSPSIHRLLGFKLKKEGLEFTTAFSGTEGLEIARRQPPSLILLDLNMPEMDGFQVLRELKNDPRTIQIPVIVLSGSTEATEKVRAFDLGAMDYVCKPFDVHELRARINSALRIHRLMEMLSRRAQIDGLTGLWNRSYFNDRLAAELANRDRTGSQLALALCDLDHFKKLNDTFGHPAGDAVLEGFSEILAHALRSYDIACRYGGEEFAIILPDTSLAQAQGVCERVRIAVEANRWPNYPEIRTSVSFGLTVSGLGGRNEPAAWVEAADKAMYESKSAGRNRITIHREPEEPRRPLALAS